jgi:C-methyltransferase
MTLPHHCLAVADLVHDKTIGDRYTPEGRSSLTTVTKLRPAKLIRAVERVRHYLLRFHQRLAPAPAVMLELIFAASMAQAITVAAELGIADILAKEPLRIDQLATRVGAERDALSRLLRVLISRGIFRQLRDGSYHLTPLAATLEPARGCRPDG